MLINVKITNFSGQTIEVATTPDWIQFTVEAVGGYVVNRLAEISAPGKFEVENGFVATRKINIGPAFDLSRPGRYTVSGGIFITSYGKPVYARPIPLEVLSMTPMWERNFGVPNAESESGGIVARRYSLIQITRNDKPYIYVSTSEVGTGRLLSTIPLTRVVGFGEPQKMLDGANNLHVLSQTGRIEYNYSVINPDGRLIVRQTVEHPGQSIRPHLAFDRKGQLVVKGGVRKLSEDDVPEVVRDETQTVQSPEATRPKSTQILPGVSIPGVN